jgi:hypothetical protein
MNEPRLVVVGRIRQELIELQATVERAERALEAASKRERNYDLYLDSAALSLHDYYSGLERIFHQVAATVDHSEPGGREWHRELLTQMSVAIPRVRPAVLSQSTAKMLDEYRAFRHVVRNVYTSELDPERVERLVGQLHQTFQTAEEEIRAFADVLEKTADDNTV